MPLTFRVSASVNVWRQGNAPTLEDTLALASRYLRKWGGAVCHEAPNVLDVTFPTSRWFLPSRRWDRNASFWGPRTGPPFGSLRRVVLTASDLVQRIEIRAEGSSTLWPPIGAAALAYGVTRAIAWHPALVSPAVGLATAALTWVYTWFSLEMGLQLLCSDIEVDSRKPGA